LSNSRLAAAAAGSAVGAFLLGFAIAAVIFFLLRRRENRKQVKSTPAPSLSESGGDADTNEFRHGAVDPFRA
jgi:hypothetical protein